MSLPGARPKWLTFDCYGTLTQWDEGLTAAVTRILAANNGQSVELSTFLEIYDRHEHELEQNPPHRTFRDVSATALARSMAELGLSLSEGSAEILTDNISSMSPFSEVVETLATLKNDGYRLCIISNTDDDIIAGNVAQMGGHVDRVITAQQAGAYKPSRKTFEFAHQSLGVNTDDVVHICASPHLDLAAARDMAFRCVWINRGTARKPLSDYVPDAQYSTLSPVPGLFRELGWTKD